MVFFSPPQMFNIQFLSDGYKRSNRTVKAWQLITGHSTAAQCDASTSPSVPQKHSGWSFGEEKHRYHFFFGCIVSLNWSEEIQTMKNNLSNKSLEAVTQNIQTLLPFYTCIYFGVSTASHLFSCTNHFLFLFFCIGDSLNR